jgi:hypothetical protein
MALLQRPYGPAPANVSGQNVFAQNIQAALAQGVLPAKQSIIVTTENVLLNPLNSAQLLAVSLPPKVGLEQIPLDINCSGYVTTTNAGNVTLKLYSGTSATVGNDKALGSTGAVAMGTLTGPFMLHARGVYDSVSGLFVGFFESLLYETLVAPTVFSAFQTGVSDSVTPVLTFLVSITTSGAASGTPTTINVQNFSAG